MSARSRGAAMCGRRKSMSEIAGGMPAPLWEETLEARVVELLRRGETVALVTIVRSAGSAPRPRGHARLVHDRGL